MCFYHGDYDWIARYCDDDHNAPTDKQTKCTECNGRIHAGQRRRLVQMQEYEFCKVCDRETREECDGEYDGHEIDPCEGECDFGETDNVTICEQCQKLLNAIQSVEEDDGCSGSEALPEFGGLREAFWESDHAVEYIDRALRDYPELAASGHLDKFYKLTHEWDERFEEQWNNEDLEPVEVYGGEGGV